MKIAIDVDGVLARFEAGVESIANKIWPGKIPPGYMPHGWDYEDVLTSEEWKQVWAAIKKENNFWLSLPPYTTNVGSLATFLYTTEGHDIYFVTARVQTAGMTVAKQTAYWLHTCGIYENHNYTAVLACDADRKVDIYEAVGIRLSIDDKGETVMACDKLANHKAYLLDRPWNQDAKPQRRVKSLQQFLEKV